MKRKYGTLRKRLRKQLCAAERFEALLERKVKAANKKADKIKKHLDTLERY